MNTFKTKLRDAQWCEAFRTYLTERYAAENLAFLLAVENFRDAAMAEQIEQARSLATSIVGEYLEPDAPMELNVSFQSKMSCKESIDSLSDDECPDPRIFDDTQVSVILLIMDYYKDFCSDHAHQVVPLKDAVDTPQPRAQRPMSVADDDAQVQHADEEEPGCLRVIANLLRGR
jgi:hypothetical protein